MQLFIKVMKADKFYQEKGPLALPLEWINVLFCVLDQKLQNMSHLTEKQRYLIEVMKKQGYKQKDIALAIDKDKSVVSRELRRNADQRNQEYRHELAQRKCAARHAAKPKKIRFTQEMSRSVEVLLRKEYSSEQVRGVLLKEGHPCVSVERIYQPIWADKKQGGSLFSHLRSRGKRYRKRGSLKDKRGQLENRQSIEQRPQIVNTRERIGDWEVDLVIGKHHQGALVTVNERKTGYALVRKVASKKAQQLSDAIVEMLAPYKELVKTITSDNGKEFAQHQRIAQELEASYYVAHPYHSWERGGNENYNGLLRQYVPKKTDLATLTHEDIGRIEYTLNNRPRKRLGFDTPYNFFHQKVAFIT